MRRLAIVFVIAMGAIAATGIPSSTVAELRAASCCASPACVNVLRASECSCCTVSSTDDVALTSVVPTGHPEAIGLPRSAVVPRPARMTGVGRMTAAGSGPPTYLRLRTLQC